jgi:hypothetical protein
MVLVRALVENGAYCWWASANAEAEAAWLERRESEEMRKRCRRQFQWTTILGQLESVEADLHRDTMIAYEASIEMGAHPNPSGVFGSIVSPRLLGDSGFEVASRILDPGSPAQKYALQKCAEAALIANRFFGLVWPDYFVSSGLSRRVRDLTGIVRT